MSAPTAPTTASALNRGFSDLTIRAAARGLTDAGISGLATPAVTRFPR